MFTIDFFYDALRQAQGPCKVDELVDVPVELAEPTINLITGYKINL